MNSALGIRAIIELSDADVTEIERRLDAYDAAHSCDTATRRIRIGVRVGDEIVAGLVADVEISAGFYNVMYISTVFVAEGYRRLGLGSTLIEEAESRARELGASLVRVDTFNWQGPEFYRAMGYEQVGGYDDPNGAFSEAFFLKRLA